MALCGSVCILYLLHLLSLSSPPAYLQTATWTSKDAPNKIGGSKSWVSTEVSFETVMQPALGARCTLFFAVSSMTAVMVAAVSNWPSSMPMGVLALFVCPSWGCCLWPTIDPTVSALFARYLVVGTSSHRKLHGQVGSAFFRSVLPRSSRSPMRGLPVQVSSWIDEKSTRLDCS